MGQLPESIPHSLLVALTPRFRTVGSFGRPPESAVRRQDSAEGFVTWRFPKAPGMREPWEFRPSGW